MLYYSNTSSRATNMNEAIVEVLGPEPPCVRCQAAKKVAEKVAEKLRQTGIIIRVE